MNDETAAYMKRTITRLEEIVHSPAPWLIREDLRELIAKMKETAGIKEEDSGK